MTKEVLSQYSDLQEERCFMCGKKLKTTKKHICPECVEKQKRLKRIEMIDKAEKTMSKNMSKAIKNVNKRYANQIANGSEKFSSVPEIIFAIQLAKNDIKYKAQKNIAGKVVDFYLPELKIIVEIDGEMYHKDENKSFMRDRDIMLSVGEEWEIIHIDATEVPKGDIDLKSALLFIISERNEQKRFRDSRYDTIYFVQYQGLEKYLNRSRGK